ncbi:porin [Ramlibacter sp. G-1-2-2]|uniref:Porin n=1 Tax=Ramlibacter agri TaxID=2728837 RepID=A0A848H977_9BURK|nr:porin [Ramlibacter agri]NML47325.1 porin [Ramlibacter agri]
MKKLRLAACLAAFAALASGAQAQSSVTLTGTVDVFAGSLENPGDGGHRTVVNSGGMTTSWFGFKGTEDLGGGLKANFALTSFFQADSGNPGRFSGDPFFSRDANVSLASDSWGSLTLGRALAPNFLPTVIFNPFGDSFTFSPLVLHNNISLFNATGWTATTPSDTGWSNEILYTTPSFGGLTGNLHYQLGEQANAAGIHNLGANLLYFHGNFAATAFIERDQVSNPSPAPFATGDRKTDWMGAASYDFSVVKVCGSYGRAWSDTLAPAWKTWSAGASAPIGAGRLLAAYAHTEVNTGAERKTFSLGYDYFLSKSTDLYLVGMRDDVSGFGSGDSFGAGIRKRF